MISINSVIPTFKQTSDPIEEVFQMQTNDTIETDYSYICDMQDAIFLSFG